MKKWNKTVPNVTRRNIMVIVLSAALLSLFFYRGFNSDTSASPSEIEIPYLVRQRDGSIFKLFGARSEPPVETDTATTYDGEPLNKVREKCKNSDMRAFKTNPEAWADRTSGTFPVSSQVCHRLRLLASRHGPIIDKHEETKEAFAVEGVGSTDPAKLIELARSAKKAYKNAKPYRHTVIDNFLPRDLALRAAHEIENYKGYIVRNTPEGKKGGLGGNTDMTIVGPSTEQAVNFFQSSVFVDFLGELTGIRNLTADPMLWGAGPFAIDQGGYLSLHTDFNVHTPHGEPMTIWRRINVLLYLNEDWEEQHGGSFELWETDDKYSFVDYAKKVVPTFNRMALFAVNDVSLHGHLDTVNHPQGKKRKSISMYYYSTHREDDPQLSPDVHSSIYIPEFSLMRGPDRWRTTSPREIVK